MRKLLSLFLFFFIFSSNLFAQEFWSNERDGPTSIESAKKIFAGKKLDHIEGIWFADGLGTVAIFKENNIFKMYIVEGDTDFNGTWEATINKEENLKYNYIGRVWYTRTDGYDFGTQNANIEVDGSGNSFSIHYERLSNEGVNMDGKFTRVWPDNIFSYNNNLDRTVDSSNSGTSSINTVDERIINDEDEWYDNILGLGWLNLAERKKFEATINEIDGRILIESDEWYIKGEDVNQYSWWTWGVPDYNSKVLIRSSKGGNLFIRPNTDGYVKIDDWKNVDTDEWIKEMNKNIEERYKEEIENNLNYVTKTSWLEEPKLDRKSNMVFYSYKNTWNDGIISNESRAIILGKKGYNTLILVTDYDENTIKENNDRLKNKALTLRFNEGVKYKDYKTGDKVAALGIGGLVAGTLGVKTLAKAGVLAKFLPLLAKFWWIIVAPLVAIFGFLGKNDTSKSSRRRKK